MDVRVLESPPSLGPLYARAAVGAALPGRGSEVPDHALALAAGEIEPERLADYCRVCDFTMREMLPPTYPHLLGFGLAMALMTERSFPFALLGLVHVANRISQRRPIPVTARPAVKVWAENLRPHRRGRQLDLVTEVSVDGDVAWLEHSTYLRPGGGSDGSRDGAGERSDPVAGAPVGAVWKVGGDVGRRYAAVSGDRNPIHMHSLTARAFGFPGAIAHGMWALARSLASLDGQLGESHTSEAQFKAPLRIPGRARLRTAERADGWDLALESADGERRHLDLAVERGAA
jgi:acyl dehydratase